ncbi:hypothetical protein KPC83_04210 [Collinsella sp. zg1085]|uniref:hypothetical protein n=1 Tax=Collinsella sp. zg1085 TaxID=2844380 RepID=UPI001C0C01A2|nr:hypothetical protein [Collinsella sp. zg1085]QWT17059.1 hypothetical protein KPC83_04210 [Collinsella sp. zg1085]
MGFPLNSLTKLIKLGFSAKKEADSSVRISVVVDTSADEALVQCMRRILVPETISGLVRVERLRSDISLKTDTDLVLVLTGGSEELEEVVQKLVICGAPLMVLATHANQVPFIHGDTPVLGLRAHEDPQQLIAPLAHWIQARTDKPAAFAANFSFMRSAASQHLIQQTALANVATGALVFIPGADFPVMTAAQLSMLLQLAMIHNKPLHAERGYEAAFVVLSGFIIRMIIRQFKPYAGKASFVLKGLGGGIGTLLIGELICFVYRRDLDYSRANQALGSLAKQTRHLLIARSEQVH